MPAIKGIVRRPNAYKGGPKAATKRYLEANKEAIRERRRKYREANKEAINERAERRRLADPAFYRERLKSWIAIEKNREWKKAYERIYKKAYRQRKKASAG